MSNSKRGQRPAGSFSDDANDLASLLSGFSPELADIPGLGAEQVGLLGRALQSSTSNAAVIDCLQQGDVVLDLDASNRIATMLLAQEVGEDGLVFGLDSDAERAAAANVALQAGNYPQLEIRKGDVEHIPLDDGVVDYVVSSSVLAHRALTPASLKALFRVIREGGQLMLNIEMKLDADGGKPKPALARAMSMSTRLRKEISSIGFIHVRVELSTPSELLEDEDGEDGFSRIDAVSLRIDATRPVADVCD